MTLADGFQFSQASLQAFVDCPRRFQLRYAERIAWPDLAPGPAMEHERRLLAGQAFHRLVAQHTTGIDPEQLAPTVAGHDLERWWRNYLTTPPPGLPALRYAEIMLTAPMTGYRLVAKYDLLAVAPGERAVIVDWKTYRSRPTRPTLAARLQTRVYAYLLARAGQEINGGQPPAPEQIEMVYWFAEFPSEPASFAYDEAQSRADEVYLTSLIETITGLGDDQYALTSDQKRCRHCQYAPLCDRDSGTSDEAESFLVGDDPDDTDLDLPFDFEQIAEVEY